MNYAQLTAAIKGYAENDFPDTVGSFTSATQIATFVEETEQRVFNAVQLLDLRKNVIGSVTANNKYLEAPSDWLANFSLAVIDPVTGEYEYLLDKDVNFIRQSYPSPTDTGKPQHYGYLGPEHVYLRAYAGSVLPDGAALLLLSRVNSHGRDKLAGR
jgi:hypothetical protein